METENSLTPKRPFSSHHRRHWRNTLLRSYSKTPPAVRAPEMSPIPGFLPIDPIDFASAVRETRGGQVVKNRCLRDALWYVLRYYYPKLFKRTDDNGPRMMEELRLFGFQIPDWSPVGGGTEWSRIHTTLSAFGIGLVINGEATESNGAVVWRIVKRFIDPFGISFEKAVNLAKSALYRAEPCVMFVPINRFIDHALFIHGIDAGNLYCLDTHQVNELTYWNTSGVPNRFTMQFSLKELEARWNRLGMVWSFHLENAPNA